MQITGASFTTFLNFNYSSLPHKIGILTVILLHFTHKQIFAVKTGQMKQTSTLDLFQVPFVHQLL